MGRIGSCVEKIGNVRFDGIRNRRCLKNIVKAVAVNNSMFLLTRGGTVLTTGELASCGMYCGTGSDYSGVQALLCLGLVTADDVKRHGAEKAKNDENLKRYRAATCEVSRLEAAGIRLTPKQKQTLQAMRDGIDFDALPCWAKHEAKAKQT